MLASTFICGVHDLFQTVHVLLSHGHSNIALFAFYVLARNLGLGYKRLHIGGVLANVQQAGVVGHFLKRRADVRQALSFGIKRCPASTFYFILGCRCRSFFLCHGIGLNVILPCQLGVVVKFCAGAQLFAQVLKSGQSNNVIRTCLLHFGDAYRQCVFYFFDLLAQLSNLAISSRL